MIRSRCSLQQQQQQQQPSTVFGEQYVTTAHQRVCRSLPAGLALAAAESL